MTEDEVGPHVLALCRAKQYETRFVLWSRGVQSRSHSLSDHRAFHLALMAFVCVVLGLLSGSSPARLAGTDWATRQIDDRVEKIAAPNHTAASMVCLDIGFEDGLLKDVVELAEPTDEDETKHYILRSDLASFGSPTAPYESSADRAAITPFRLLAFSSRGSPSA